MESEENMRIILASASPRRKELLGLTGWRMEICPVELDESPRQGEPAEALARRLASAKAEAALGIKPQARLMLAADTLVVDDDQILGKPADEHDAQHMLMALRDRSHRVISALDLRYNGQQVVEICETIVPMRDFTLRQVQAYIETGSPLDKAGAYGIQDRGFHPVAMERMKGCFANVMGLPLCHLVLAMHRVGLSPKDNVPLACQSFTSYDCSVYPAILRGVI
ncbi:MAG TPA: septum formation protein Maf [Anaerolineae bacterium]|nr:septum formation protein Maf [Anaerolineae bacterium]